MKRDRRFLNLRKVHRNVEVDGIFFINEHAALLIQKKDKYFLQRKDEELVEVVPAFISKEKPSVLRSGELARMLGIDSKFAVTLCNNLFSYFYRGWMTKAEREAIETYFLIPVKKREQKIMHLVETADYSNDFITRKNIGITSNYDRAVAEVMKLKAENKNPMIKFLIWQIKVL
jgi:hypothetical protein